MPGDYANRLTAGQIDTLVDFLLEQKGPTTVETELDQAPPSALSPVAVVVILAVGLLVIGIIVLVFIRLPSNGGKS